MLAKRQGLAYSIFLFSSKRIFSLRSCLVGSSFLKFYYRQKISVGSSVLVQGNTKSGGDFHSAVVADEENGFFDVMYDDEAFGDEEMIVASRLVLLGQECSRTVPDTQQVARWPLAITAL